MPRLTLRVNGTRWIAACLIERLPTEAEQAQIQREAEEARGVNGDVEAALIAVLEVWQRRLVKCSGSSSWPTCGAA